MNFFERELHRLFSDQPGFEKSQYVGRACLTPLSDGRIAKAEFTPLGFANHYEGLRVKILDKNSGEIDSTVFRFSDCFEPRMQDLNHKPPYIWQDGNRIEWYYRPTLSELAALSDAATDYIDMFREDQTEDMGMSL